ncbi:peptide chain release factor 3 [[Clostridium] polysaccharolyticum]|uniref:Peptide chain release factor 3 n=1 Tax=[Clostridium] polysaccharolyticum TaxID=29364 RepID=A0A1H9YMP6_9FIRM|nr:peptide chain release factor 3 [[Clostridium] polysaccharolyticum]SES70247.1 peptide chain release factor 3 [[Clostridium] polysaccharolyticum]
MSDITNEIKKRRTFAIISHPDAGKTTLTEKFLLYGGAINLAGSVKGRKASRHAVSDWMEIEKERGISVTSSVLQFNYDGYCINILDTPGHQDFSEDTYRTLMAADSAVMVIDGSKGVEAQTIKLFKVCVMRGIPIFTFVNKMDREANDPFELIDEIETVLGIRTCPINWPIGSGKNFKGVYDRQKETITRFYAANNGQKEVDSVEVNLGDANLDDIIGAENHRVLMDEIELLDGASDEFDLERVQAGKLSPVFFGSALTNFGVETFLRHFLDMTTTPLPRNSDVGEISPFCDDFSAFVFKIQANMNKAHRDRIAFMRICSGKFDAGMEVFHVQGNKKIRLSQPQQMMAQERHHVTEAYAGDIIGVFDPGIFSIGDTLCTAKKPFQYEGIPTFAPEHFAKVRQIDTMKRKQFIKGIEQIAQEGAIQIFQEFNTGMEEIIVGVVGVLQFDVLKFRLESEYRVEIRLEPLPYEHIRWIENDDIDVASLSVTSDTKKIKDLKGNPLLIFTHPWSIRTVEERNEGLKLSEFGRN